MTAGKDSSLGAVLFEARHTFWRIDGDELLAGLTAEGLPVAGLDDKDVCKALLAAEDFVPPPGSPATAWCALLGLPASAAQACARALSRGDRRADLDADAHAVVARLRSAGVRVGAVVRQLELLDGLPAIDAVVREDEHTDPTSMIGRALDLLGGSVSGCWFVGTSMQMALAAKAAGLGRVTLLDRYAARATWPGVDVVDRLLAIDVVEPRQGDSRPAPIDVNEAARLAEVAVRALSTLWDPAAPGICAPMWRRTERLAQAILSAIVETAKGAFLPTPLEPALAALAAAPLDRRCRRTVNDAVRNLLMVRPPAATALRGPLTTFDRRNRIDQWYGGRYDPHRQVAPVTQDEILRAAKSRRQPPRSAWQLTVVIDFRDVAGGLRLRNTIAALAALNDQTLERSAYHLVAVEQDSHPRHRAVIEPMVDRYVFASHGGQYQRAWAHNVGAVATGRAERYLCFLDADVLLPRTLLESACDFMSVTGCRGLLPLSSLLHLDEQSSELAIRRRLLDDDARTDEDECNGYRLMTHRGGCIFVETDLFYAVGGFDERYQGWGDEDNEFFDRVEAHTEVAQFTFDLPHLYHPRAVMEDDGRRTNDWLLRHAEGRSSTFGDVHRPPNTADSATTA
ncbi:galactosyltransferase-related protein [Phytohabitans sp. LJ34]|uniref:galactosyltransferase-related protein n=1 Tax=Phytohabitans sp. LJ34 TaxID=3452217 RepID=UPI003F8A5829